MSNADRTTVRYAHGAIHVTREDSEDRMLITNAHTVLDASTEVLGTPYATLREVRFTANELARSLRDMLDLVDLVDPDDTDDTHDADDAEPRHSSR